MGWNQLQSITDENREINKRESREPPIACPIDGTRLDEKSGVRNCPMGNYRWAGGQVVFAKRD